MECSEYVEWANVLYFSWNAS